jgi:hypothetical protein
MGFWDTFNDFKRSTRVLFLVSLLLGIVVLAAGLIVDGCTEWLNGLNYVPNIWAGFTGFLIGAPFALIVLATFTVEREETAASDRVQNLTMIAWNQFRDAIGDLCSQERMDTMESIAKTVQGYHNQTLKGFENYENNAEKTAEDYRHLQEFIAYEIRQWGEPFAQMMRAVGTSHDLGMSWYAALRDWNTLDQYVRLQRLERGLPWFNRRLDSFLQQRMNPAAHPMQPFFDKHEGPAPKYNDWRHKSMWAAYNSLDQFVDLPEEQFTTQKVLCGPYFPSEPVGGYLQAVEETALNMRQLLLAVQEIDRAEWLVRLPL